MPYATFDAQGKTLKDVLIQRIFGKPPPSDRD